MVPPQSMLSDPNPSVQLPWADADAVLTSSPEGRTPTDKQMTRAATRRMDLAEVKSAFEKSHRKKQPMGTD
jgi:hypothetical protein